MGDFGRRMFHPAGYDGPGIATRPARLVRRSNPGPVNDFRYIVIYRADEAAKEERTAPLELGEAERAVEALKGAGYIAHAAKALCVIWDFDGNPQVTEALPEEQALDLQRRLKGLGYDDAEVFPALR